MDWLNAVDATYRTDLRELNELNFARFEAKLELRIAQLDAKLEAGLAKVKSDLLAWMFGLWVTTMLGLAGLYFRS